ncbi:MAG: DegV family protein [Salinivirgaceae bacterium]|nr:DegV family protein [Salinivirgaceae bacterium]
MFDKNTSTINGKTLYYAFVSGGNQILQHQAEINRINVFPVNDKDTGTNLASTVRWVLDNIRPHKSYSITLNSIAEAALIGARGNSGVIFAQFLYGLSRETINKPIITISEFAESVKHSIPYIYDAIANPVEGTILTIIKDWSDFLSNQKERFSDFKTLIINSLVMLEVSLKETNKKLKALHNTDFVDAGAKGFFLFVKGMADFVGSGIIPNLTFNKSEKIELIHSENITEEVLEYRYCTEAIIKNTNANAPELHKILSKWGDSAVVAGSDTVRRIHVHTNQPALLFSDLKEIGTVTYQKVDDMVRQQELAFKRKWNIALVTDSTCDLPKEILDHYQITVVPLNLNFGDSHYLDKVTITPDQFYDLLESEPEFPKTSQINEQTILNLYSHLASHYDAIISIHLTSHFSGTFANCVKAGKRIEKEFNVPVHVIDSKNLSGALGLTVLDAAQRIEKGESMDSILNSIKIAIENTRIYVSVKDLKYMIKGGRVSKPKGMLASYLGLNPVISMDKDGKSTMFGKTFSQESSLKSIYKHIELLGRKHPISNYIILHAHNSEGAERVEKKMIELTGIKPVSTVNISPVIGMHAGIGTVAISLMFNN